MYTYSKAVYRTSSHDFNSEIRPRSHGIDSELNPCLKNSYQNIRGYVKCQNIIELHLLILQYTYLQSRYLYKILIHIETRSEPTSNRLTKMEDRAQSSPGTVKSRIDCAGIYKQLKSTQFVLYISTQHTLSIPTYLPTSEPNGEKKSNRQYKLPGAIRRSGRKQKTAGFCARGTAEMIAVRV